MAEINNINYSDNNEIFFIKTSNERFDDYLLQIIEKDLDIVPRSMDTLENRRDIHKYIKNLFLCCAENSLCCESFKSIWFNAFKDGFNLAMNLRMNR